MRIGCHVIHSGRKGDGSEAFNGGVWIVRPLLHKGSAAVEGTGSGIGNHCPWVRDTDRRSLECLAVSSFASKQL